jgi:hypothetical protein
VVGWNTASLIVPRALSAGSFWLAYFPSDDNLHFRRAGSGSCRLFSLPYGPMPSVFSTTPTSNADHWSFYGTLTP